MYNWWMKKLIFMNLIFYYFYCIFQWQEISQTYKIKYNNIKISSGIFFLILFILNQYAAGQFYKKMVDLAFGQGENISTSIPET